MIWFDQRARVPDKDTLVIILVKGFYHLAKYNDGRYYYTELDASIIVTQADYWAYIPLVGDNHGNN